MAEGLSVKPVRAITWTDVGGREAPSSSAAPPATKTPAPSWSTSTSGWSTSCRSTCWAITTKRSTSRRKSSCASSAPSTPSAASRPSAPGSTASSSTRRATGSAGGGGATARSRSRSTSTSATTAICRSTATAASPDRLLGQKQLAERIRVALDQLPFDQKTALVLREIDGLSYEEIGFSLGIAVGTVKSRLARARESAARRN